LEKYQKWDIEEGHHGHATNNESSDCIDHNHVNKELFDTVINNSEMAGPYKFSTKLSDYETIHNYVKN